MEKEFVPYEQALALKELGFDEPCYDAYTHDGGGESTVPPEKYNYRTDVIAAPLYQQAFRWFREKYHIIGEVKYKGGLTTKTAWYNYVIYSQIDWEDDNPNKQWKTYEEAELECLKKLIEIAKTKEIRNNNSNIILDYFRNICRIKTISIKGNR